MIIIIDFGTGNVGSIRNMLKKIGADAVNSNEIGDIETADKLILPGVGAFDSAAKKLYDSGLAEILRRKVLVEKIPILGICLGMHLMTQRSEEGELPGLGWIDAETRRFNFAENSFRLKIPHMGWNSIEMSKSSTLFADSPEEEQRFYFVHSYHVVCNDKEDELSSTNYGYEFTSAFQKDNIIGVQFHPEKSHKFGINFFKNFIDKF